MSPADTAIVLLAHGSRDPQWRQPVEAVARRVAARAPGTAVRCAYLELTEPDLPAAVAELVEAGARRVRVLPVFLGMGKHAREDLPRLAQALKQSHPGLELELLPAAGEQDRLIDLLAQLAVENPRP